MISTERQIKERRMKAGGGGREQVGKRDGEKRQEAIREGGEEAKRIEKGE